MKVKEVADRLGLSAQTVRNWSNDFSDRLGPAANPEKGRTRQYSENDLRILAGVKHLKEDGLADEEITEALANQSLDIDQIPIPEAVATGPQDRALEVGFTIVRFFEDAQEENRRLQERVNELEHQVGFLEGQIEARKGLLDRIRGR